MQRGAFVLVAVGLAVGLVAARDGVTHHGWSGYDSNVTLNLTGVIKQSGYEHPHGFTILVWAAFMFDLRLLGVEGHRRIHRDGPTDAWGAAGASAPRAPPHRIDPSRADDADASAR